MRRSRPRSTGSAARRGQWFGWVHVFDPHAPYTPPPDWQATLSERCVRRRSRVDRLRSGSALRPARSTESRPTLVIVTADHGESLGEHGEMTHGIFAYESTLHVPLIVAEIEPGRAGTPRRGRHDAPARHVDIVPTILDAIGAPACRRCPAPRCCGRATAARRSPSYFESMMPVLARGWAPLRGVLVGREKYVDLPIPELYDLSADPREQQNLAAVARRTHSGAPQPVCAASTWTRPISRPRRPLAARERLRALGYTGGSAAPRRDRYTEADDPEAADRPGPDAPSRERAVRGRPAG